MDRDRRDVDLPDVVDADRPRGADVGDGRRIIGLAAAIQHVVGGKRADLAARPLDADSRAHLERVPLDSSLELLIAIVREPHRAIG